MYAGLSSISCMQYHLKTCVFGLLCTPLILISSHLDEAWEKIEHEIGGYSAWAFKVNFRNGVLPACSARSHFKPVKVPFFSCATGTCIISTRSTSQDKMEHSALPRALFLLTSTQNSALTST